MKRGGSDWHVDRKAEVLILQQQPPPPPPPPPAAAFRLSALFNPSIIIQERVEVRSPISAPSQFKQYKEVLMCLMWSPSPVGCGESVWLVNWRLWVNGGAPAAERDIDKQSPYVTGCCVFCEPAQPVSENNYIHFHTWLHFAPVCASPDLSLHLSRRGKLLVSLKMNHLRRKPEGHLTTVVTSIFRIQKDISSHLDVNTFCLLHDEQAVQLFSILRLLSCVLALWDTRKISNIIFTWKLEKVTVKSRVISDNWRYH